MTLQVGRMRNTFTLKHKSAQDVLVGVGTIFQVLARALALAGAIVGAIARRRSQPQ